MNKFDIKTINNQPTKVKSMPLSHSCVQFRGRLKPAVDTLQLSTKNTNVVNKLKLAVTAFIGALGSLFLNKSQRTEETGVNANISTKKVTSITKENTYGYKIPEPLENTTTIKLDGYYKPMEAKFYKENNEDFAIICDNKFKVEYLDKETAYKRKFANNIYVKAGIAEQNYLIQKGDSDFAILTPTENNKYDGAFDKLSKDYNLNLFLDNFEINENGIVFDKNGKKIKIEILEDDDVRLTQKSKNEIYRILWGKLFESGVYKRAQEIYAFDWYDPDTNYEQEFHYCMDGWDDVLDEVKQLLEDY